MRGDKEDYREARILTGISTILIGIAVAATHGGTGGGIGFLFHEIPTPIWFHISAVALPFGEIIKVARFYFNNLTHGMKEKNNQ